MFFCRKSWLPGLLCVSVFLFACALSGSAQAKKEASLDIGTARDIWDGSLYPDKAVRTYSNTDKIFPTRTIKAGPKPFPLPPSAKPLKSLTFASAGKSYDLPDYVALNRIVGLLLIKDGTIAYEHYDFGFTPTSRWMSMSLAKSFVSTLVGAAIKDGFIGSVTDPVTKYLPQLAGSAYDKVSVRDVLMMSSGVKWDETYVDPRSDRRKYLEIQIASDKPGAIFDLMKGLPKAVEPGTKFNYSTGETVLIGEIVQAATKRHLAEYLSEKIWAPLGMEADASWYLDAPGGHEVGGSGVLARLRDFGRFGQFFLDGAKINGKPVVPDGWIAEATGPRIASHFPHLMYGYQWWVVKAEPGGIHEGAFMGRGIHGQYLYINPREKVVAVCLSARPKPTGKDAIADLDFLSAAVQALRAQ